MKKFKLELEVNEETKLVTVKDSRENELKQFEGGIFLIAADGKLKQYYGLTFGSSADLGWAIAQMFNDGWASPFVKRLFYHFTDWINKFMTNFGNGYDLVDDRDELENILNRWNKEDKEPTTFN